jgi:16S rRNA (uracil1498-N3)-methyltransferase
MTEIRKMSPRAPHRFFVECLSGREAGDFVELSPGESHHLIHVLRSGPGSRIELFDAAGAVWAAETGVGPPPSAVSRNTARVRLLEKAASESHAEGVIPLYMAVATLKRRAMDWMIEKLSELGVEMLVPLLSARCVGLADIEPHAPPPPRWQRLAIAAAKQCGRSRPMRIECPTPVEVWLERDRPPGLTAFAHPYCGLPAEASAKAGAPLLGAWLGEQGATKRPIWIAIGPEGGWTPAEVAAFERHGFEAVRLGALTLRAETAALAAAAAVRLLG